MDKTDLSKADLSKICDLNKTFCDEWTLAQCANVFDIDQ